MGYLDVIFLGYIFNFACFIISTLVYFIYFTTTNDVITHTIITRNMNISKAKKKFLILNGVNPYRQKDFIALLPFGYGVQLLFTIMMCFTNHPAQILNDSIAEEVEYYDKLIEKHNLNKL